MANSLSERHRQEVVTGKAHGHCSDVAIWFCPLVLVLKHSAARCGSMETEGMTTNPAQEFGEHCVGERDWSSPLCVETMLDEEITYRRWCNQRG